MGHTANSDIERYGLSIESKHLEFSDHEISKHEVETAHEAAEKGHVATDKLVFLHGARTRLTVLA